MARKAIHRPQLIEDVHIILKRENRARTINKRLSEQMISIQEREMNDLKRRAKPLLSETYQELSLQFNILLDEEK